MGHFQHTAAISVAPGRDTELRAPYSFPSERVEFRGLTHRFSGSDVQRRSDLLSGNPPSVTVLIAARPEQKEVKAVAASRALDYPAEQLEIIVARGKQPSAQRNAALRAARGDLIYFLDDDSVPERGNLRRAIPHFVDERVQMLGGPNLCPPEAPAVEQVFALVLASGLAFGPSRARYARVGKLRETSEKELILCNLIARRKTLLDLGGFNESLYPNEENAIMDELRKRRACLLYDPGFTVWRRPRPNLRAFCGMLRTYGRGRAEQLRANPTPGSILNFVPPTFCFYLAALLVLFGAGTLRKLPGTALGLLLSPLLAYVLALVCQGLVLLKRGGFFQAMAAIPLIVLTHILYGGGFVRGLFTRLRPRGQDAPPRVSLEVISHGCIDRR